MNSSNRTAYFVVSAMISVAFASGCTEVSLNQAPIVDRSIPANAGPAPVGTPGAGGEGGAAPAPAEAQPQAIPAPSAVQTQPLQGSAPSPAAGAPAENPAVTPGPGGAAAATAPIPVPAPAVPPAGSVPAAGSWIWPVHGEIVRKFDGKTSKGIEIAVNGGENVVAVAAGTVLYAGSMQGYGRLVIVRHPDGVVSVYAHNRSNLVHEGQPVRQGDPIAIVGGDAPTTFLFEVRRKGVPLDPMPFLGSISAAP